MTTAARVPSLETASEVGFDVRGSWTEPRTANVAASMTSSAAAARRVQPPAVGADGERAGRPARFAAPTGRRVVRSMPEHPLPAAT